MGPDISIQRIARFALLALAAISAANPAAAQQQSADPQPDAAPKLPADANPGDVHKSVTDLDQVGHAASLLFMKRDSQCVQGVLEKSDAATVTVKRVNLPDVTLERADLLQISQGNALVFSGRSSWADVTGVHLDPLEELVVELKDGEHGRGKLVRSTASSLVLKHGLHTARYAKVEIKTVDYLRWKPATDKLDSASEKAPWSMILYPESYSRLVGHEGRLRVRLYDASKPEDNSPLQCKREEPAANPVSPVYAQP